MLNYASMIFKDSGSELDPNMSAIILITVQIFATFTASLLVDKLGRRLLMLTSTTGTAVACAIMGVYTYFAHLGYDLHSNFNWVPIFSLSLSLVMSAFGIFPLPFVVMGEVLPAKVHFTINIIYMHFNSNACSFFNQQIRAVGSSYCTALISVFLFIIILAFPMLTNVIGLYGMYWFFTGVCVLGMLFTIFILHETTGKNINA